MYNYPLYKLIKQRIAEVAPVFYYIGQYQRGKDNTSYRVPAIYIELPSMNNVGYNGKRTRSVKGNVKIHLVTNAPFKNHDNSVQDSALADHDSKLDELDALLHRWVALDAENNKVSQQFLQVGTEELKFIGNHAVSVLIYNTEFMQS